jgi:hypothetical protein
VSLLCLPAFDWDYSGRHVVVIANRTILSKNFRRFRSLSGVRPRSRTLTAVHDAILEVSNLDFGMCGSGRRRKRACSVV